MCLMINWWKNLLSRLFFQKESSKCCGRLLHCTLLHVLNVCFRNIDFQPPPYDVEVADQEVKLTYLDTVGRPVVVCRAQNLVEQHIQDFQLNYTFERVMLLQEPLLIVVALYLFFLFVIIVVRLDFSITKVCFCFLI